MSLIDNGSALRRASDGRAQPRWCASATSLAGSIAASADGLSATVARTVVIAVTRDWQFRERLTRSRPASPQWRICRSLDSAIAGVSLAPSRSVLILDIGDPHATDPPAAASCGMLRDLRRGLPELVVVVVVREPTQPVILALLASGVHGVIAKSAAPEEIREAVGDVARGRIYVPAEVAAIAAADDGDGVAVAVLAGDGGREAGGARESREMRRLTPRQRQVLERLVAGKSNKQIARELQLGEGTVKVHLAALLRCLKVSNRTAAAAVGARLQSLQ